jgi:hypothetical protein
MWTGNATPISGVPLVKLGLHVGLQVQVQQSPVQFSLCTMNLFGKRTDGPLQAYGSDQRDVERRRLYPGNSSSGKHGSPRRQGGIFKVAKVPIDCLREPWLIA